MSEPQVPTDPGPAPDLARILGQRRAFAAVAGRCSAAHAQLLRRIHDEKLYLPHAKTWEAFCEPNLAVSRRHADRVIALLNRFGPVYFELAELVGLSPKQYLAVEPAVREHAVFVNGEAVSLIPEKSPILLEAVDELLRRRPRRRSPAPETLLDRVASLRSRGSAIANQLVALYNSAGSARDRELIVETAAAIRDILMQTGID